MSTLLINKFLRIVINWWGVELEKYEILNIH